MSVLGSPIGIWVLNYASRSALFGMKEAAFGMLADGRQRVRWDGPPLAPGRHDHPRAEAA